MSWLYPRTVKITRSAAQTGVGALGYSGLQASSETVIATGLPASIQLSRERGKPETDLPGDATAKTFWKVMIPLASAANGLIQMRDIVTDELGIRYQVIGPYWNSLGFAILVERLEA